MTLKQTKQKNMKCLCWCHEIKDSFHKTYQDGCKHCKFLDDSKQTKQGGER
jgi:hypothetical protein